MAHLVISSASARMLSRRRAGFVLSEFLVSAALLLMATLALLTEGSAHLTLTEHARNVSLATNDAVRTLEQLRQQNSGTGCSAPSAAPPVGFATWDAWLGDTTGTGGGGKSIQPDPLTQELVLVRPAGANPLQVTVSVCWRHRNRTLGGCGWDGAQLTDLGGITPVPSPVMLFTRITCQYD
ncbi:MAG: hypothetical protein HYY59_04360 [Candidatus Omnitrophica bacterium]|nr:hypothetical protein [Candidatus Omnitrophota bacterium]MBI2495973.1 hypothetical protein [Candidatus Omnitrophota bacterium]MBI3021216.1 hypothetical protein [Candidatus Omnitrophota bacterium]